MEWTPWIDRGIAIAMLVFVCRWMMQRSDIRDTLLQGAFEKLSQAVDTFSSIEKQNCEDHLEIIKALKRIEKKT